MNGNGKRHCCCRHFYPLIAGLGFLCFIAGVCLNASILSSFSSDGFINGFETELPAARGAIEMVRTQFTGGIYFDDRGKPFRETAREKMQYVGTPKPEIDKAWDDLLPGLYQDLSGPEARPMVNRTWKDPEGNYMIGLEVVHTLHCVNHIRKTLDADYYAPEEQLHAHRLHTDHCLDHLRQFVQCHADLTPLTFSWSNVKDDIVADWDAVHTCRNFRPIKEWAKARVRTQPIPHSDE